MKIAAAMDSFKGSCSAQRAGEAVLRGVRKALPTAQTVNIPVSDGGDGLLEALSASGKGKWHFARVTGPLGEKLEAGYIILNDSTAVIEMSAASGITRVPKEKLNPRRATTRGTGELILAALNEGCRKFIIGIGGSATNDGGAGMACALGAEMKDAQGQNLPDGGAALKALEYLDVSGLDERLQESSFIVASDVRNPLCGEQGASKVYGPQKGADAQTVDDLDAALFHYAEILKNQLGKDVANLPGAGAAGGLGAALYAFLSAEFRRGIDAVLELLEFDRQIADADLVFVGEGRTDAQTLFGKAPSGTAEWVKKFSDASVVLLAGGLGDGAEKLYECGVDAVFSIADGPISLEEAQNRTEELLERAACAAARLFAAGRREICPSLT